jgi:uncharacterized protein (TIGR03435 family)
MILNGLWTETWPTAMVNHLWQSTLVLLVAWMLTLVLRRNQAQTRYWLWMAASLKFLVPFSLLAAIGDWLRPANVPAIESPQIASAMAKMAHPFLQSPQSPGYFSILFPEAISNVPAPHQAVSLPEIVVGVWLCGLLFLLLRWLRSWWGLRRTLRSASQISMPVDVPAFLTPHMIEPGVVGIMHPVLLLPEQIMDRLSPLQLRSILAHESCHVRRRDNLTAAIHMAVEAIFWFHPAVWWLERRLIEERERACDEAVLQLGNEAEVYAESILNVCKCYAESPIACMSGVTGSELKQRIVRIMTNQVAIKLDVGRKLLLSAVAVVTVSAPVAFGLLHLTEVRAQSKSTNPTDNIVATWQGTLHTNRDVRFVVKIAKVADGKLQATSYFDLAMQPGGINAISTTLNGSLLKMELPFGAYEGTLSGDGSVITGTWKQEQSLPLIFVRATPETEWAIPQRQRIAAMAADANPTFEVSTIKPGRPEDRGPRLGIQGRRFTFTHASLNDLFDFAYGLQHRQISGAPDWATSESYDISAVPDGEGEPNAKQWQSMVKKLMADRFLLKFHYEKRELPVYALTLAKSGSKLKSSDSNEPQGMGGGPGSLGATNVTMADIAQLLGHGFLDRPVVDQTGLTGRFDLKLRWTPDEVSTQSADAPPEFYTAIQEQLGLKLVATKAPVDVMVIDRVERPSAN